MGTDTDVGSVAAGGFAATAVIFLIQWLAPSAPVTPELSAALVGLFTVVFTFVLPKNLGRGRRRSRRDPERLE